jgi:hypothetical protein
MPLAVGKLPGEMIATLHAVRLHDGQAGVARLAKTLTRETFGQLVERKRCDGHGLYEVAATQEERMTMMERYARSVLRMGFKGHVRARQSVTIFGTPDKPPGHPVWKVYYGPRPRSTFYLERLLAERAALYEHAREAGCSLILSPARVASQYDANVAACRLRCLADSLRGLPDDKVRVGISRQDKGGSVVLCGDWFATEAVLGSQGAGYQQTIFTRHAPSLQMRVDEFDSELKWVQEEAGWDPTTSKAKALAEIDAVIKRLDEPPAAGAKSPGGP